MDNTFQSPFSDLRLLRCFLVLMAECSVSRAAARLGLSQPAMSHSLGRLRKLFDDPLLLRSGGTLLPTTRGLELKGQVADLIRSVDGLLTKQETFDPQKSRSRFKIMTPEFASHILLPFIMRRLEDEAPGIDVELAFADPERAADLLAAGEVDFRLGSWPKPPLGLRHKPLLVERLVCLTGPAYPGDRELDQQSYVSGRHIRVQRPGTSFSMHAVDQAAAKLGHDLRVILYTQNTYAMAELVSSLKAIGTTTERLGRHLASIFPLTVHPLPVAVPELKVAIFWHERTHNQRAHRWFRKLVGAALRDARIEY